MYKTKNFGFTAILVGVCFLCDPIIGLLDFLPDLVGWILICIGISSLADLNDDLMTAGTCFCKMLLVGIGRILAELLVSVFLNRMSESLNPYETAVWTLLLSFALAVIEICLLLPAFRSFWHGIATLSECSGNPNALTLPDRKGRTLCEKMQAVTTAFVIFRAVLSVLPETVTLTVFAGENTYNTSLYQFRGLFRTASAILVGIAGLLFLIAWIRFYIAVKKETAWLFGLREKYEREVLPKTEMLRNRKIDSAFSFFRIGILLSTNLSLLYYEILPDWLAVSILLVGCFLLGNLMQNRPPLTAVGAVTVMVGIVRTVFQVRYLKNYIPKDALHLPEAYESYFPVCVSATAEAILTALFIIVLTICILKIAMNLLPADDGIGKTVERRDRRFGNCRAILVSVFACLSAVAKIAETFLQAKYGWIWLVQTALSIITFAIFSGLLGNIQDKVERR